jgi:hypothetical protein
MVHPSYVQKRNPRNHESKNQPCRIQHYLIEFALGGSPRGGTVNLSKFQCKIPNFQYLEEILSQFKVDFYCNFYLAQKYQNPT